MTDKAMSEALRLADGNDECAKAWLESSEAHKFRKDTAAELRRLHAENEALRAEVERLQQWQQHAFDAHPNIDLDIEFAVSKQA